MAESFSSVVVDFSIQLTSQGKSSNKTKTKETKTKLLTFKIEDTDSNHIDFLQAALDRHEESFKITRETAFRFKYLLGSKA